jgi:citrate lyase subunit beta/citryl-CoA lyase
VFEAGADEVLLDLEDAVPPDRKAEARARVTEALAGRRAWVRVNAARTELAALDLEAVRGLAAGVRVPKVESAADVAWVVERAGGLPVTASVETALGIVRAFEIASAPGVTALVLGGVDLALDLAIGQDDPEADLFARSALVIAARAAGLPGPIDGVYANVRDEAGLRRDAERARRLGFFGKSAIHPRQLPVIHEVFAPSASEVAWAERVLAAFAASGGAATRLEDGEMVDIPVAERARRILDE